MNSVQNSTDLLIADEFKALIRPLSHTELEQLEIDIKNHGCLSPIVIWSSRNTILDGHNRFEICKRNNIEYKTINLEFLDENDAKIWIIKNQFSRRNLSAYERCILAFKLDSVIKEKARENQLSGLDKSVVQQNSAKREKEEINTNKFLSKIASVSHDTISRVRKIEEFANEETKQQLMKSKLSINQVYEKIKKQNAKDSVMTVENTTDESDKYDVIYTRYYHKHNRLTRSKIDLIMKKNSTLLLWTTSDVLEDTLRFVKRLGFKYVDCLIWEKNDEYKSFEIFIIAILGKPEVVKHNPQKTYSETATDKLITPKYYRDLIEKWFPNKKLSIPKYI